MSTLSNALAAIDKATLLREKLDNVHGVDHIQLVLELQVLECTIDHSTKPALAALKEAEGERKMEEVWNELSYLRS